MKKITRKKFFPEIGCEQRKRQTGSNHELQGAADENIEQRCEQRADGIAGEQRGAQDPGDENGHGGGDEPAQHAYPACDLQGAVEPPENGGGHGNEEHRAEHAHRPDLAEEMRLVVAEELLGEVLEPDEAELQAIARESHAAHGKDDGIEGRKDREDQDERDGGRNEKSA